MSMDNYIYIEEPKKKNGLYKIWDCMASYSTESDMLNDLSGQKMLLIGKTKTLEKAVKLADKQESEYGISFSLWAK